MNTILGAYFDPEKGRQRRAEALDNYIREAEAKLAHLNSEIVRNERRFQAACAAMQGPNFAAGTAEERKAHLAKVSVEYADALLKELEK